jgi:esterase/lipase superfamily enzyme
MRGIFVEKMLFAADIPGGGPPVGVPRQPEAFQPSGRGIVKIFYATDREPTSQNPLRFGSRRSSSAELNLGTCEVSIPRDHRLANIERPTIWRLYRENQKKHFVIREVTGQTADGFFKELSHRVAQSEKKEAFVFIHGFSVDFNDAVYRTAQIAYDLGFEGAPIMYSWPSNGKLYRYTADINNSDWTVQHLKGFLQDLASRSDAQVIHLIAHSMGNRALTNALNLLAVSAQPPSPPHFSQIVLTAPDIDAGVFIQLATAIQMIAERITLYVSGHDRALHESKRRNGSYPRVGDCSGSVIVVPGMDTVDASAVDTNLIGHFYYAENRSVLSDIFNLLKDGSPPERRFGIRRVDGPPPYWQFSP